MLAALVLQLVVVSNATLIDPDVALPRRNQSIVLRDGRVEAVGDARTLRPPAGARVIDATGKFVIPGMWDMHVHADLTGARPLLGLFIASGVTGVRDMNGELPTLRRLQRAIDAGTLVGPRMVVSGPYISGRRVPIPHLLVTTAAEATRAVDSLARLGVDFVKVHNRLTPEVIAEVARSAQRRGLTFAGHVSLPTTPLEAARLGQRSQEHLYAFPNVCTRADSLVIAAAWELQRYIMGECTSVSQEATYAALARERSWVTPTLGVQRGLAEMRPLIVRGDSTAQYYSDTLMARLAEEFELPATPAPAHVRGGTLLFEKRLALVRALHRAGVPLLGGTDSPLAVGGPGGSLAEELRWLVRAGLTPREALRTVTTEPARYFAADSLGAITAGKVADLVVLDADPTADIGNVRRIATVVARGRVYDATALEGLRREARRQARAGAR